jgi:hypothetical protein
LTVALIVFGMFVAFTLGFLLGALLGSRHSDED